MEDNTFKVYEYENIGEVRMTEETVAKIAALAATEVDGVDSLANGLARDNVPKASRKSLAAAVDLVRKDDAIDIYLSLVITMGVNIPSVCTEVQEKVKSAVESITGLKVGDINIKIGTMKVDK